MKRLVKMSKAARLLGDAHSLRATSLCWSMTNGAEEAERPTYPHTRLPTGLTFAGYFFRLKEMFNFGSLGSHIL